MKVALCVLSALLAVQTANAATPVSSGRGRSASNSDQMMGAPRASATQAVNTGAQASESGAADATVAVPPEEMQPVQKDMREKEKKACLGGNIGMGNTFVWASRFSNLNNYASMFEDLEEPENNTCFVKVEVKSNDPNISVADVPAKYFEMGSNVKCGDWANYDTLKQRILDSKKKARTWATVGGAVGGAAIGVGAMEAFGNRAIGGKVMGQKALEGAELLKSQLAVLKKDNLNEYNAFIRNLKDLKTACEGTTWDAGQKPAECEEYEGVFDLVVSAE